MRVADGQDPATRAALIVLGAAALAAGLYGRFAGLGLWPLGVDEFYISRSIDNVLHVGIPEFPCGGYYTRGLLYQYAVAALRLAGGSPEFAGRLVAGVCSLALLPAVYLLGRRVQGALTGWLVAIMLCVSIWEIEMARFARMYAPFQALFGWYLLEYLRFTVDRDSRALKWMALVSVMGVLTWEGGVLLGVANLVAVLYAFEGGRPTTALWRRLAGFSVLLVFLYLATRDLRGFADIPGAPDVEEHASPWLAIAAWFDPLGRHPAWIAGLIVPLAPLPAALRGIAARQDRWPVAAALGAALASAFAHAFLLCGSLLLVALLIRLIDRRALGWREAPYVWLTLGACLAFWLAVMAAGAAATPGGIKGALPSIAQRLLGFPDVYDKVLRPWVRTLPFLSLGLLAAAAVACRRAIIDDEPHAVPMRSLLYLIVILVLAVGAIPTDRVETRYTFFLYPALLVLAVGTLVEFLRRRRLGNGPLVLLGVPLCCFAASEDFQPIHLAHVDTALVNFRVGMSPVRADHYYPKNDIRGAADWLAAHVRPGDVVITGIPSLDEYYPRIDYVYLDSTDDRYEAYVCRDGKTDRWTNRPVLYTEEALKPLLAGGHRVYASVYGPAKRHLRDHAAQAGWSFAVVWRSPYGGAEVASIQDVPGGAAPAAR